MKRNRIDTSRTRILAIAAVGLAAATTLSACGTRLADSQISADANTVVTSGAGAGGGSTNGPGGGSDQLGGSGLGGGANVTSSSTATASAQPGATGGTSATGGSTSGGGGTSGGSSGGGAARVANLSSVTIGNVGTYSGIIGQVFVGAQQALKVGIAYVNAHGGLNGHPINLVSADDGGDPSTNETEVQTMVQSDHAIAMVSNFTPLSSSGSLAFLEANHIPVVGGDLYDPLWFGNSDYFPQGTNVYDDAIGFANTIKKLGISKAGMAYCVESPICVNFAKEIQAHAGSTGVDLVYDSPVSLTQPSYTSQCVGAQQAGVQALILALDSSGTDRATANCLGQGYKPVFLEAGLAVGPNQAFNPNDNGLTTIFQDFSYFDTTSNAGQTFHTAFHQLLPGLQLNEVVAEVWTATQLLAIGGSKLPATGPTGSDMISTLDGMGPTTINGFSPTTITFHAGKAATSTPCYLIARVLHSAWVEPYGNSPICNN